MDTLDRAAGLADNQVADASNSDWLLESALSSQLSTDLRRYKLEVSLNSTNSDGRPQGYYGTTARTYSSAQNDNNSTLNHPINGPANPISWFRANYVNQRKSNLTSTIHTINNHLYDNISFADSPILRSLSRKNDNTKGPDDDSDSQFDVSRGGGGCCFHRFRIFLACYVLFGITLAMYSRNALSLAAVGMVANNEVNRELVSMVSSVSTPSQDPSNATIVSGQIYSALDGSCPVRGLVDGFAVATNSIQTPSITEKSKNDQIKNELETRFRASIERRIERGELVDWTPGEQGLIFAAGSVGNLLIAIPLSRLGEIYGSKWIIFLASLGATIQAALMPIVSPCHVSLVILFQVVFNGLTFGADCVAYTFFAHWLPPQEMAFFVSCLLICYQLGSVMSSFITSKILEDGIAWGWCFYTPAILCGIWTIIWALIGASEPSKSKLISSRELLYLLKHSKISSSLPKKRQNNDQQYANNDQSEQHSPISWLKLAKDPNIWAIIAVKFTLRWYFSVYASMMPTYLSSVAHMSIGTIGKMSVVQSFISLALGILMGYMTKSLVSRRPYDLTLATTRKIFQSIVNFGLALSMIVFIMYDCNQWVTIITLTLGGICINFYCAAALQLPLDLSPKHCGLITSITNTLALGQAIGAPISGLILNSGPKDRALWRIVWGLSIVINIVSGLIFILLVDSKPRDYTKYNCQTSATTTTGSWEEESSQGRRRVNGTIRPSS